MKLKDKVAMARTTGVCSISPRVGVIDDRKPLEEAVAELLIVKND